VYAVKGEGEGAYVLLEGEYGGETRM
jgi:hypothetical protein